MQPIIIKIGRILLSILFILSAISKILALGFFDNLVAELVIGKDYEIGTWSYWGVQFLSRFLISLELLLGVAILQNQYLKKWILPAIVGLVTLFTLHLIYEGLVSERGFIEGNCGCFGDLLPMNNLESILKNVVTIGIALFVWKFHDEEVSFSSLVPSIMVGIVSMGTLWLTMKDIKSSSDTASEYYDVFEEDKSAAVDNQITDTLSIHGDTIKEEVLNDLNKADSKESNISSTVPVEKVAQTKTIQKNSKENIPVQKVETKVEQPTQPIDLSKVRKAPKDAKPLSKEQELVYFLNKKSSGKDFSKGEHLITMFSLTCGHCQESYQELCGIAQDGPLPPASMYLYGNVSDERYFKSLAKGCVTSSKRFEEYTDFRDLLQGEDFPRVVALKNGKILKEWNLDTYNEESVRKFYGIKKKAAKPSNEINIGGGNNGGGLELTIPDNNQKQPWE